MNDDVLIEQHSEKSGWFFVARGGGQRRFDLCHKKVVLFFEGLSSEYTWHVPRVHKRVLKLVNFEFQNLQFPSAQDLRLYK